MLGLAATALITGLLALGGGQAEIEDRLHTLLAETQDSLTVGDDAAAAGGKLEDNWYIVQMGTSGQVVGRMHTSVTQVNGLFESTEELEVVLQRGALRLRLLEPVARALKLDALFAQRRLV